MLREKQASEFDRPARDGIYVATPRHRVEGDVGRGIDAKALWELVKRTNGIDPDAARTAYTFLCETVCNVIDHAYPSSVRLSAWQSWDATVSMDTFLRRVVFEVRDAGVGIPASIRLRLGANDLSHTDLIRFAVTKQVGSPGDACRGRGLSGMADKIRQREGYRLGILTAGHLLSLSTDQPEGRMQNVLPVSGTAISFSVPLTGHAGCRDE